MIIVINATNYTPTAAELEQVENILQADTWHQIALGHGQARFVNDAQDEFARRVHFAVNEVIRKMMVENMNATLRNINGLR